MNKHNRALGDHKVPHIIIFYFIFLIIVVVHLMPMSASQVMQMTCDGDMVVLLCHPSWLGFC